MSYKRNLSVTALIIGLFFYGSVIAEISVEPFGFAVSVEVDEEVDVELVLSNDGEDDVEFSIDYELVVEEDDRGIGPRRDDPGDVLAEYDVDYSSNQGLAWDPDNGWLWGNDFRNLYAFNPETEEFELEIQWPDANIDANRIGGFYLDGVLWFSGYQHTPSFIYRYDTEGNAVDERIQSPQAPRCLMSTDGELIYLNRAHVLDWQIHVYDPDDWEEEVATIDYREAVGDVPIYDFEWVTAHSDGQLWLGSLENTVYQCFVDDDWNCELVQEIRTEHDMIRGITHDGENLWFGFWNSPLLDVVDDGVREFGMLIFDTEEGVIAGQESETVTITFDHEGYEDGVYNVLIEILLSQPNENRDDFEESVIQITALVSLNTPVFNITGTVTEAGDNDAIAGARIEPDRYFIAVFSDEEGNFVLPDLPPDEYTLTFSATDFLTTHEQVLIEEEDVELDIAMLQAVFAPSRDDFLWSLGPDEEIAIDWHVTNQGNGPLTFSVERRLMDEEANADPWTLRYEAAIEEIYQDNMINGVTFAWGHFYVSGGNNGENPSLIYVFDSEGERVNEFDQAHESRYGMRDLTFDGELIWGADEGVLYGYTLQGEHVATLEGEARSYRSLTWDPINEWFWSADITSDIYATDREGNLVETLNRPGDFRTYGLAYWPDDPDGHCLYVFSRGDEIDIAVYKINLDNGEALLAAEIDADGGRPAGIHITNQLDIYSWVMMGIVQTPDRLGVWQLAGRREWFQIDPEAGEIEAAGSQEFILDLNATDLPVDNDFEGELVFLHDGEGSETHIPVTLRVEEGEVRTTRDLDLHIGWNTVSVNLHPDDNDEIRGLMAPLVNEDLLILMKNGAGQFYIPEYDFSNIPGWLAPQGYQLKMRDEAVFRLEGMSVLADEPIDLHEGWQLIAYFPRSPVDATIALSGIMDNLIIAKDGQGNFYIPAWNFSNIGDMRPGQGYYVNVDAEEVVLVYRLELPDEEGAYAGMVSHSSVYDEPGQLPVHAVTGVNMSLLVLTDQSLTGDIGVYSSGNLIGSGVLNDGICGIAIWGDDPSTDEIDGALEDQLFEIRLLSDGGLITPDYSVLAGEVIYQTDDFAVIQLSSSSAVPIAFGISSAYPNPFNSVMRINYGLVDAGDVSLFIYDMNGRRVADIITANLNAGVHFTVWNAGDLSSGIYLVKLVSGKQSHTQKVVLIK